jgi:hypothetical protein
MLANDSKTHRIGRGSGKCGASPVVVCWQIELRAAGEGISREYIHIYEEGGRTRRRRQAKRTAMRCPALPIASLFQNGLNANRARSSEKHSGPPYYPEIAPMSPRFVGTTF